jgi:hypothetical protein
MGTFKARHGELRSDPRLAGGRCGWCNTQLWIGVICPTGWPINTVGLSCRTCGAVIDYQDELTIFTAREALKQIAYRQRFIMRHGVAVEAPPEDATKRIVHRRGRVPQDMPLGGGSSYESTKALIMSGVDSGMELIRIAELLDLEERYVKMIVDIERSVTDARKNSKNE